VILETFASQRTIENATEGALDYLSDIFTAKPTAAGKSDMRATGIGNSVSWHDLPIREACALSAPVKVH